MCWGKNIEVSSKKDECKVFVSRCVCSSNGCWWSDENEDGDGLVCVAASSLSSFSRSSLGPIDKSQVAGGPMIMKMVMVLYAWLLLHCPLSLGLLLT